MTRKTTQWLWLVKQGVRNPTTYLVTPPFNSNNPRRFKKWLRETYYPNRRVLPQAIELTPVNEPEIVLWLEEHVEHGYQPLALADTTKRKAIHDQKDFERWLQEPFSGPIKGMNLSVTQQKEFFSYDTLIGKVIQGSLWVNPNAIGMSMSTNRHVGYMRRLCEEAGVQVNIDARHETGISWPTWSK